MTHQTLSLKKYRKLFPATLSRYPAKINDLTVNKTIQIELPCGTVYCAARGGLMKPWTGTTVQMKAIGHFLHVVLFIMLQWVILTFKSVHEPLVLFDTLDKVVPTFKSVTHQMKTARASGQFPLSVTMCFQVWERRPMFV